MGTSYEGVIVSAIGEFGLSQFLILLTLKLSTVIVAWGMVMPALIAVEPKWWKETKVVNISTNSTSINRLVKVCPTSESDTGVTVFDDSIYTIVSEWNLICKKAWIPLIIMTTQMVGVLVGAAVFGQMSDWFGRRKAVITAYVLVLLSMLGQGLSLNWYMFIVFGVLLGFGLGGFLACDKFYLEFIGTKWRTLAGYLPAWAIGVMLLGGAFKVLQNWRHICYANVAFGFPVLVLYKFCPESIRWSLSHGRADEAKKTLEVLAHRNKRPTPDFDVFQEYVTTEKHQKTKYNYITLFSNTSLRWRVLIFGILWFTVSFGYYTITFGVSELSADVGINMVLQGVVEIIGTLLPLFLSRCLGRQRSAFLLMFLLAASSFGTTVAFFAAGTKTFSVVRTVLSLVGKFFVSASWLTIWLFTIETFPTVIRNTAYGLSNVFARVGGILSPQNKTLNSISAHLPFTINGTLQLVSAFLCLFLTDTYAAHLEDNLENDEQQAQDKVPLMGEERDDFDNK